jgi:hypothetical protein
MKIINIQRAAKTAAALSVLTYSPSNAPKIAINAVHTMVYIPFGISALNAAVISKRITLVLGSIAIMLQYQPLQTACA